MPDNFRITVNNIPRHQRELESAIHVAMQQIGDRGASNVANITPVDTGNLKNRIDYIAYNDHVVIGTNVEYAIFQEMGTIFMRAANNGRGYLRYGLKMSINDFKGILEEELRNL